MKKLILAAAAASVLAAAPAAAAPSFGQNDRGRVEQVQRGKQVRVIRDNGRRVVTRQVVKSRQVQTRNWRKGDRFDNRYARNYRIIQNPRAYRLYDAPRGYRWVQADNDAVLVAITSGIIGAVLGNVL
jgi:Ni/Co efflux regulator RcnB